MGKYTSLLSQSSFFVLNKNIVKLKGFEFASILSVFCRLQEEFETSDSFRENNGFFQSLEKLQEDAIVCKPTLLKVITELKDMGILIINKKGIPCRNYYKVNDDALEQLLQFSQNGKLVGKPIDQLDGKPIDQLDGKPIDQLDGKPINQHINNNNTSNKKEIEISNQETIIEVDKSTNARSLTKDEVKYFNEIKQVIDFFNELKGSNISYTNKEYNRCIISRLKEKATIQQMQKVLLNFYYMWKDDFKMNKFVKIDTLLNEKFWGRVEMDLTQETIYGIKRDKGINIDKNGNILPPEEEKQQDFEIPF